MKKLMIFALAISVMGCGARKTRRGTPAPIPGCAGAYAWVPEGCYTQVFPDRVEVRCGEHTTKFSVCQEKRS